MVTSLFCSKCQHRPEAADRFCPRCGTPLLRLKTEDLHGPSTAPRLTHRLPILALIAVSIVAVLSVSYILMAYRVNWGAIKRSLGLQSKTVATVPAGPSPAQPQPRMTAEPGSQPETESGADLSYTPSRGRPDARPTVGMPASLGVYAQDGTQLVELQKHYHENRRFMIPIYNFTNSQPVILVYLSTNPQAIVFRHPESETNFLFNDGEGVRGERVEARVTPFTDRPNLYRIEPVRELPQGFTIVCVPDSPSPLFEMQYYGIRLP